MASASTLQEGEIVTLLGRNGAGKTTTLRSLVGLTPAREGVVRIFGKATTHWPPYAIAALGVGYVPEGRRIFGNLTVEENLKVPLERPGHWTIPRVFELFPRLARAAPEQGPPALRRRAGDARHRPRAAAQSEAAAAGRALPGPGAADRAGGLPGHRRHAQHGHVPAAGGAERARRRRDRRPRLCAGRRAHHLRGLGRRARPRRGARPRPGRAPARRAGTRRRLSSFRTSPAHFYSPRPRKRD